MAAVVALHIDLNPHLGVAVERDAGGRAEDLLPARAKVIRECGHGFSVGLQQQPTRSTLAGRLKGTIATPKRVRLITRGAEIIGNNALP